MKFLISLLFIALSVQAQDSAYDSTENNLTAEDEAKAQNYIHQGMADQEYREMCFDEDGKQKSICRNNSMAFDGGMGTLEAMMPAITKAYALFNVMGGNTFTANNLNDNGEKLYQFEGEENTRTLNQAEKDSLAKGEEIEGKESTEEKPDYCGYIGMAGEAVNTAMVAMQNEKTQQNYQNAKPEAKQAAGFYSLAENEKSMKKGANMQFYVWGASAACYTAYVAQAQYQGDWKAYAKLAGSTAIALFYKKKANIHGKRADLLAKMAKDLPQAGDCNPYTDTSCFCNENSSYSMDPVNYKKYCLPDALASRANGTGDPVPCVDANGKLDTACQCAKNNTCIDRKINMGGVDIGLNPIALKDPLAGIKPLSSGIAGGNLDSIANKNLAIAQKALKKYIPDDLSKITASQKKQARDFAKLGIPAAAAARLASLKGSASSLPKSMSLGATAGEDLASAEGNNKAFQGRNNTRSRQFKSGGEIKSAKKSSSPFAAFKRKSRSNRGNPIDIEKYAEQATQAAEIRSEPSTNIFDVISYRYKMSAWRNFPKAFDGEEKK